jgi:hypothetical protein
MENLFLGHFAATTAPGIVANVKTPLEPLILDDEGDAGQLAPLLAEAEIVVRHIWRAGFPPAVLPKKVTVCNVSATSQRWT